MAVIETEALKSIKGLIKTKISLTIRFSNLHKHIGISYAKFTGICILTPKMINYHVKALTITKWRYNS